jgi:hypothetical protein
VNPRARPGTNFVDIWEMKLKTLLAITVIVNSTCRETFYHIFANSSLDFFAGRKARTGTFFF